MIGGNEMMPLPNGDIGIWDEANGAFRLTCLVFSPFTCEPKHRSISLKILFVTMPLFGFLKY